MVMTPKEKKAFVARMKKGREAAKGKSKSKRGKREFIPQQSEVSKIRADLFKDNKRLKNLAHGLQLEIERKQISQQALRDFDKAFTQFKKESRKKKSRH